MHVTDFALKLEGASSDLSRKVAFNTGLNLREGGQLAAQGSVVPGTAQLQADVRVTQLVNEHKGIHVMLPKTALGAG